VLWISGGSTIGCEWSVDFMAAGADTWYECQYTYAHWAQYTTRAQVDADKAVDESEENNNELDKMVLVRHS
jgi:subtilase family serine protease